MDSGKSNSDFKRPRCFFDISVDDIPVGRLVFELFAEVAPKTSKNFLGLCTGEHGISDISKVPLNYEGCNFHRIVDGFMIQGGDFTKGDGTGGESIYGRTFSDENFTLRHDKPYLLSMANRGKDTNGSQFFILTQPASHLDNIHVVFGHVIHGQELVHQIERVPVDMKNKPTKVIKIARSGELVLKPKKKTKDEKKEKKVKKKEKKKKEKKAKKEKKDKITNGSHSKGEEGHSPNLDATKEEPQGDLPEECQVPSSRFLNRLGPAKDNQRNFNKDWRMGDARDVRQGDRMNWGNRRPRTRVFVSRTGHEIRGRGTFSFRTPSRSRSRSRSPPTPPHWRREERKITSLDEVAEKVEKRTREEEKSSAPVDKWAKGDKLKEMEVGTEETKVDEEEYVDAKNVEQIVPPIVTLSERFSLSETWKSSEKPKDSTNRNDVRAVDGRNVRARHPVGRGGRETSDTGRRKPGLDGTDVDSGNRRRNDSHREESARRRRDITPERREFVGSHRRNNSFREVDDDHSRRDSVREVNSDSRKDVGRRSAVDERKMSDSQQEEEIEVYRGRSTDHDDSSVVRKRREDIDGDSSSIRRKRDDSSTRPRVSGDVAVHRRNDISSKGSGHRRGEARRRSNSRSPRVAISSRSNQKDKIGHDRCRADIRHFRTSERQVFLSSKEESLPKHRKESGSSDSESESVRVRPSLASKVLHNGSNSFSRDSNDKRVTSTKDVHSDASEGSSSSQEEREVKILKKDSTTDNSSDDSGNDDVLRRRPGDKSVSKKQISISGKNGPDSCTEVRSSRVGSDSRTSLERSERHWRDRDRPRESSRDENISRNSRHHVVDRKRSDSREFRREEGRLQDSRFSDRSSGRTTECRSKDVPNRSSARSYSDYSRERDLNVSSGLSGSRRGNRRTADSYSVRDRSRSPDSRHKSRDRSSHGRCPSAESRRVEKDVPSKKMDDDRREASDRLSTHHKEAGRTEGGRRNDYSVPIKRDVNATHSPSSDEDMSPVRTVRIEKLHQDVDSAAKVRDEVFCQGGVERYEDNVSVVKSRRQFVKDDHVSHLRASNEIVQTTVGVKVDSAPRNSPTDDSSDFVDDAADKKDESESSDDSSSSTSSDDSSSEQGSPEKDLDNDASKERRRDSPTVQGGVQKQRKSIERKLGVRGMASKESATGSDVKQSHLKRHDSESSINLDDRKKSPSSSGSAHSSPVSKSRAVLLSQRRRKKSSSIDRKQHDSDSDSSSEDSSSESDRPSPATKSRDSRVGRQKTRTPPMKKFRERTASRDKSYSREPVAVPEVSGVNARLLAIATGALPPVRSKSRSPRKISRSRSRSPRRRTSPRHRSPLRKTSPPRRSRSSSRRLHRRSSPIRSRRRRDSVRGGRHDKDRRRSRDRRVSPRRRSISRRRISPRSRRRSPVSHRRRNIRSRSSSRGGRRRSKNRRARSSSSSSTSSSYSSSYSSD